MKIGRTASTSGSLALGLVLVAACGGPPGPGAGEGAAAREEAVPADASEAPEPAPTEARSRFTLRGEHEIHYLEAGAGEPALVFVHGWACDQSFFQLQMDEFSASHRCLAVDLPGHGRSSKPPGIYSMAEQVEALLAVLDDAEVGAAVIVGHSNGVPIALEFVRRHPARSLGLINLDGMLRPFSTDANVRAASLAPYRGNDSQDAVRATFERMMPLDFDLATRRHVMEVVSAVPRHVVVESFEGVNDPAQWGEGPIEVPLLAVHARASYWTEDYEEFTRSLAPWVEYHVLDGVGHLLLLEAPERLHPLMRDWLKGL